MTAPQGVSRRLVAGAIVLGLALAALGTAGYLAFSSPPAPVPVMPPPPDEAGAAQVHRFCGACHASPPPDSFPRDEWRKQVKQGYDLFRNSNRPLDPPSLESVALWYERRAPEAFPPLKDDAVSAAPPVRFERRGYLLPDRPAQPAVSNVSLARLFDPRRLDVLVCDARLDAVLVLRPYEPTPGWRLLASRPAPAHAEVTDLDGDGNLDVLVACLGEFYPTDARVGSVVWLRGLGGGKFTPVPLLEGVGRVADVQAADFNGDGKLDLVVAVFGWQNTGEVLYLENRTTDWSRPEFARHVVDARHGAIHVPVADLDSDGRPDFVALLSQEHETVVAYLNDGNGRFRQETLYAAPHPAFGCSGIQLVDLDGDGKTDVLLTNGDVMDPPHLARPDHGVHWLHNRGRFPFEPHLLAAVYGVERAVAADFDGDGRLDVAAVSFLPPDRVPGVEGRKLGSVVLLAQTAPGRFDRHCLEAGSCDHFTCAAGDVFGDGRAHLVTGSFFVNRPPQPRDAVTVWKNLGPARGARP